jgi:hypothetical protein
MFAIKQKKDNRVVRCFTHKLADIAGGVNIATSDLTQDTLPEGVAVGKDSNGIYHVVKTAVLAANAANDATTYTVKKGHNFVVGDFIMLATGAKSYAITAIATNSGNAAYDDITVGTTLGKAATAGDSIMQANAQSASTSSTFKYAPIALTGEGYDVKKGENIFANVWLIGVIKEAALALPLPAAVKNAIPGIRFI